MALLTKNGQAALHARSIMFFCCKWLRFSCAILEDCMHIHVHVRGLCSKLLDLKFDQQILGFEVCVHKPRIIVQKSGSDICAAKSSDGPNSYFLHNIYIW